MRPSRRGPPLEIDDALVSRLIADQFPTWRRLPVEPVVDGGWDNRTFRLGANMLVRLPSAAVYAAAVGKEQTWLPRLAKDLPAAIPTVRGCGRPDHGYPWPWSIYGWIEGEPATPLAIADEAEFASSLAGFLKALHRIPARAGPPAGDHNFHRGGRLHVYDAQMREAIRRLEGHPSRRQLGDVWDAALSSQWSRPPIWVHGDFAPGNLLVAGGRLCGVIDFGQLGVGDPACDLVIAWTLLRGRGRRVFREVLALDPETWARARGWAAWKAAILIARLAEAPKKAVSDAQRSLEEVLGKGGD